MRVIAFLLSVLFLLTFCSAKEINISELSLDEKIGQMVMLRGSQNAIWLTDKLPVGGVFIDGLKDKEEYIELIQNYQKNSKIALLVATDMEGYWNPLISFFETKSLGEITSPEDSFTLGKSHGKILDEIGFNINFAPVVEVKNNVWPGRSFQGNETLVKSMIQQYIQGLQSEKVMATAKHYPGGNMLKDPHRRKVKSNITKEDISYFNVSIESNVSAIMIGHAIVYGEVSSNDRQATISKDVISGLRKNFDGLIITDAIQMMGLRFSYLFSPSSIYVDSIKAGNDIVLDTSNHPKGYKRALKGISKTKKAIEKGDIQMEQIDSSVERILKAKGYEVVR